MAKSDLEWRIIRVKAEVSPERIIAKMGQKEVQLARGESVTLACREAGTVERKPGASA